MGSVGRIDGYYTNNNYCDGLGENLSHRFFYEKKDGCCPIFSMPHMLYIS